MSEGSPQSQDGCIFCAIVAGDAPAQILDRDEHTLSFMDINPATRGHALVIPQRHSEDLTTISPEDLQRCAAAAQRLTLRMRETLAPDGFNLLNACGPLAWQTVFHFHLHVIPRYADDPLKLPYIPRGGDMDEIARTATLIRGE
jgi:histidine triad (HIT) family protein